MSLRGNNPHLIKELNRALLMRIVREEGPISRASLARKTGLSGPAVLNIVDGLVEEGLLSEIGIGSSSGGRKPYLLDINPEGKFAIGLEITPNKIRAGIVTLDIEIIAEREVEIHPKDDYVLILNKAAMMMKSMIKETKLDSKRILGIGVSHPGIMGEESGKVLLATNLKSWKDVPLVRDLEKRMKLPVIIEVDSRVLAIAEMWQGLGKNVKNFLLVEVNTGVGSGLVIDSKIYRGAAGIAGELGHMVIADDGIKCACGKTGCLETYISFPAILNELRKNPSKILTEFTKGKSKNITIENVINAASEGDEQARSVIRKSAKVLGKTLGNIMNFIDLESIFINSDLTVLKEDYIDVIRKEADKYFLLSNGIKVTIKASGLGRNAAIIGAGILILQEIFHADQRNIINRRKKDYSIYKD